MEYLFVAIEGMTNPSITATDSTLLNLRVMYYVSSIMEKGIVPRPAGIDTDARWGYVIPKDGFSDTNYI